MKLSIKVVPSSSRDVIVGWLDEALKVKIQAPAEQGKANQSVEKLLAKTLGLPKGSVRIISGMTSRLKVVEIDLLSEKELIDKLPTIT